MYDNIKNLIRDLNAGHMQHRTEVLNLFGPLKQQWGFRGTEPYLSNKYGTNSNLKT